MLQKKICLLGAFGVGKTSLVRRYVDTIFSDAYLTTVGVKIDKKVMTLGTEPLALILWDIAGEDDMAAVRLSYLRGAAGYLLVVDGTRPETLETAASIQSRVNAEVGRIPFLALLNKADLVEDWALPPERIETLQAAGWTFRRTSAKTGDGVEASFQDLAALLAR
ncbi:small GTP-binding protein domain protein [Variovorax sp. PBL-H6]|uniref:Rab family GTPase n=1 Tax=Variovorax sp. PBL-H6 TaxID=434009 RepID=UPI00131903FC|nr:Rab family GTPase [Variovorax sp. PBL-H6]VTU19375.1 small GTP-binding protein domain protein [Variovorax sp. PBL-H6]